MLINKWLPHYDVTAIHKVEVNANAEQVFASVRTLDVTPSPIVKALFTLRSLPAIFWSGKTTHPLGFTLDSLLANGFILLEEKPPGEIVLGLVGRFWKLSGGLKRMDAKTFAAFSEAGYTKAVWNFHLTQQSEGTSVLSTETRVLCTDHVSRKRFLRYWKLVGPFSGLIRREMLRTIKQQVDRR